MSLYVRDWTAVSPLGIGRAAFQSAVRNYLSDSTISGRVTSEAPTLFESFDKKLYLGKKGVRGMDRLGAYATIASHLLANETEELNNHDHSRIGVVLGTGTGSLKSQITFIEDLHVQERVEWVDPIQFPQTVMNCAAGQVSIWHRFTGVNMTVSSGYHSGVTACEYAGNLFRQNRVDWILVGSAEEHCQYSRNLFPHNRPELQKEQNLGEGCAMVLVSRQLQAETVAEIFGYQRYTYSARQSNRERIATLIYLIESRMAARKNTTTIRRICFNAFSDQEHELVNSLVNGSSKLTNAEIICSNTILADCLSSTNAFQLCLLLAANKLSAEPCIDTIITFDVSGGISLTFIQHGACE